MTLVRNLDGTGNLAAGKAGFVYQRSRPADQALIDSLLVCEPSLSTDSFCNNGQLVQSDLSLTSRTVLGNVSHAPTSPGGTLSLANSLGNVFPTAGLPSLATFLTTPDSKNTAPRQVTDFYSLTPSTSGSLLRLTTQVP